MQIIDKFYGSTIFQNKFSKDKYLEILEFNKYFENISWGQMLYNYIQNITISPLCDVCGINHVKYIKFKDGYAKTCSKECRYKSEKSKQKRIETNLIKYGCENPRQNKEIAEKVYKTSIEKYGTKCSLQNADVILKTKQTMLNEYGVEFPSQNKEIRKKVENKNLDKFDVVCNLTLDSNKEKVKQTNLIKYGVEYPVQNKNIHEKIKNTNLIRYGTEYPNQNEEIKEKIKNTMIEKYGVEHSFQSELIKKKIKNTNLIKYGVENPQQNKIINNKTKETNTKKFGVEYPVQNVLIKEKIYVTKQQNYKNKISELLDIDISNIQIIKDIIIINNYCQKHNQFEIEKDNLYGRYYFCSKKICTKCYPIGNKTSVAENEIKNYLKENNINFIEKDRKTLNGYELDVLISGKKIAIEYDGLYWHSNKYKKNINYHLDKTEECEKQNIKLLHIFEDDWLFKCEIVKSIINENLNIAINNINFSNCNIIKINNDLTKEFFINNSICTEINNSDINLGLYYKDELLYVLSFLLKDNNIEIINFCNKINYKIFDVKNKLFEYIIKEYSPNKINLTLDRKYFSKNTINLKNFKLVKITKPKLWYFLSEKRVRHSEIINDDCYTIYDSGNLIYEYNVKRS